MDTETVKRRPCDHAGVVVFDDEHIVFGESCSQLGRPGLAEGDTARVMGLRLHDGDGRTPVECGLDGADNWAFGIDRDADHLGAGEFEHVENGGKVGVSTITRSPKLTVASISRSSASCAPSSKVIRPGSNGHRRRSSTSSAGRTGRSR